MSKVGETSRLSVFNEAVRSVERKTYKSRCDDLSKNHFNELWEQIKRWKCYLLIETRDQQEFAIESPGNTSTFHAVWAGSYTNCRSTGAGFENTHFAIFANRCDIRSAGTPCQPKHLHKVNKINCRLLHEIILINYLIWMRFQLDSHGAFLNVPHSNDIVGWNGSQDIRRQWMEHYNCYPVRVLRYFQHFTRFVRRLYQSSVRPITIDLPKANTSIVTS